MKYGKRFMAVSLGVILCLGMSVCASAKDISEGDNELPYVTLQDLQEQYKTTGKLSSEKYDITNQTDEEVLNVLEKIYENTGAIPTEINAGEIFLKTEDELANESITRATTIPTSVLMKGKVFDSDWSGTINYTYTKYLTPQYISGNADTSFSVDIYDVSSKYLFSLAAKKTTPYYWASTSLDGKYGSVYGKFINTAKTASKNAIYELQNY
jgi:hypothetical protein